MDIQFEVPQSLQTNKHCKIQSVQMEGIQNNTVLSQKIIQTNKYGRGTERHLPKTDESFVWPAGEHRKT